jgi:GMP synthase-like glutamine amidotransferase
MRALTVFQHVPHEGPGMIAAWARERGIGADVVRLDLGHPLPDPASVEALVVLGGPMGVNDESDHPWLAPEKQCLRDVLERQRPVLGICLGSQLIASALGARVYRATEREIGCFPVRHVSPSHDVSICEDMPERFPVLQWHGDTFDLPDGAVRLAKSEVCPNQAFFVPPSALALQFHIELTEEGLRDLIRLCPEDLRPGPWVQAPEDILARHRRHAPAWKTLLGALLDRLFLPRPKAAARGLR